MSASLHTLPHALPPLSDDSRTLRWPFFDEAHRQLRAQLQQWATAQLQDVSHDEIGRAHV